MSNGGNAFQIQDPTTELRELLLRYGITTPPSTFFLTPLVSPVSIVDSRVAFTAQQAPVIWDTRASAGILTNPAANTRLFDTGALAAGAYNFQIWIAGATSATGFVRIKQRDAADAADVHQTLFRYSQNPAQHFFNLVFRLGVNERVVAEVSAAPGAGIEVQGVAWFALLI